VSDADAPDEVGIMANLRLAPPLPILPSELHGRPIVGLFVCYAGPIVEGEKVLRPLRDFKALPGDPEPERHKAWARTAWEAVRPYAKGVYVNFSDEPATHVRIAYGDRNTVG
jgi:hypothetical protein